MVLHREYIIKMDHPIEVFRKIEGRMEKAAASELMLNQGRILIVDDELHIIEILRDIFTKWGYTAVGYAAGKDALQALKEQDFDLLLTDLSMPEMQGLDLLKAALEISPHLVVIIMTAHGTIETAVEAMKLGAFDYILKPLDFKMLIPILSRGVEVSKLRKAEAKYRSFFENSVEGIYQMTPDGRYVTANYALARILGCNSPDDLLRNFNDGSRQLYVDTRKHFEEFTHMIQERGEISRLESQVYRRDGSKIWISENVVAISDIRDNVLYFRGSVEDITDRKRAEEKIRKQVDHLAALREIDRAITANLDLGVTLKIILEEVVKQLKVSAADIFLLNPHAQALEYVAELGFDATAPEQIRLPLTTGPAWQAAIEQHIISVTKLSEAPGALTHLPSFVKDRFESYFAVPLIIKGKAKGVLEIFDISLLEPAPDWFDFLDTLSIQAAIAIDNAELFNDLQRSNNDLIQAYEATIEGWSRALDYRDKETEGHSQRVTDMTIKIARSMGMREDEIVHVRRGALLHDIGKLGVPDIILFKPGKLNDEEFEIVKRHAVFARDLLSPISYLRTAIDIPYCHHEKWDGTGYPRGLKGEEIPLAARIFAVVDVWDALSSDRPYRPALSKENVFEYIREQAGKHFDPRIAEVFLRFLSEQNYRPF